MITVDGREIKFKNKTREETVKIIIDAIEKDYLSDEVIHQIQLICVVGACEKTENQCAKGAGRWN